MGISNNYKISELEDKELEDDLNKLDMVIDKKALVIAELTRRRIKETKGAITDLKKSIDDFSSSSKGYSRKLYFLTWVLVVGLVTQILLAIPKDNFCTGGKVDNNPRVYNCTTIYRLGIFGNYSVTTQFTRDTPLP